MTNMTPVSFCTELRARNAGVASTPPQTAAGSGTGSSQQQYEDESDDGDHEAS